MDKINSGEKLCYKIYTKHNSFEASEEHKILVFNKDKQEFTYENVLNLRVGDLLGVSTNHKVNKTIEINKEKPSKEEFGRNVDTYWDSSINFIPNEVTKDFARLFGFLLGDGFLLQNNKNRKIRKYMSVCFAGGTNDLQNKFYSDLLEKFSGKKVKEYKVGKKESKSKTFLVNSVVLSEILLRLGYLPGAKNKRIPSWVFSLPKDIQIEFLKGFVDADGTENRDKWNCLHTTIELCNENLISDLKILTQSIGYKSGKIRKRTRFKIGQEINGAKFKKEYYDSFAFTFYPETLLSTKEDVIFEKIINIEKTTLKETFDIYVENENHNFFANGVVVHNSLLEPVRRTFRVLTMLEDSMLLYRVVRSSERRVFYIDTTGIAANDIGTYMEQVTEAMKGKDVIDKVTGRGDLRYNPMTVLDDYFIPIRANDKTRIETLAGGTHVSAVEDLEYMQKKLIAGLKVPKAYLTYTEDLSSKAGLAMEDIRFSRTINSLQKIVVSEFNKIAILHLFAKGFEGEDLVDFELRLSNPSTIAIQQKLQTWSTKFDIAAKAKETGLVDTKWIQRELLQLTEEEIMEIKKGKEEDKLEEIKLETMKPPKEVGPQNSPFLSPFDPAQQSTSLNANGVTPPNQVNSQGRPEQVVGPLPSEKEILRIPGSITNPPIKPSMTPNLDNSLRKLSRRKTYSGANATGGVGDISNMVSANNRSFKDFTDKSFFKNPLLEQELINALDIKFIAGLPNDVVSMLSNFEKKTYKERQKIEVIIEKPLHEEIEITIPSTNKQIVKENTNENKQLLLNDVLNILEEE